MDIAATALSAIALIASAAAVALSLRPSPTQNLIEEVQGKVKQIQLEWDDTYDKLLKIAGRVSRRAERADELGAMPAPPNGPTISREEIMRRWTSTHPHG